MFDLMRKNNDRQVYGYNPFREMKEMEKNFFADPFGGFWNSRDLAEFKTDVLDEGDHYELEADLPGFDKKDIRLELQGDSLLISAERHSSAEQKNKDGKVVHMERSYGSYQRSFDVSQIDTDNIRANYDNGVLRLILPKREAALPESRVLKIE